MTDTSVERETLWAEGTWSAAVAPRGVLLLPPEVPEELVAELWRVLRDPEGTLTAILDRLVMGAGGRLSRIPDFALVLLEKSGTHLALRGSLSLRVDGESFDAAEVATWMESFLPGESSVVLSAPEQPGTVLRPAVDAVVRAARLQLGAPAADAAEAAADAEAADAAETETVQATADTADAEAADAAETETVQAADDAEVAAPDAQAEADEEPAAGSDSDVPEETGREQAARSAVASEAAAESDTAEFAAVQSAGSPDLPGDHDGWTVADLPEDLVEELGRMLPEQQESRDEPEPTQGVDTEATEAAPTRMALSVICPSGHANPTNYVNCRECGAELTQPARIIACPPLGRVRVSSGGEVVLDRPVLVGREPSPEHVGELNGAVPAVVTVPSEQQVISRNHLLIELDEWSVLARSLSAGNGTVLRRDGISPMRMSSTEPVLLRSGDILDLGDGQSLLLEDLP
ncbi:FHA domain-containing protein [Actinomyces ruminicola]|uniref:FHA domain-containing protein n=1 Tax=Actinomyces ruminicola TaxID=332524 RepID=A0A1H0EY35_9ACTO|nr:FHA domain-containing protein [Actinomyces ruminicola]SDN87280.1 FHA domain-containing protein [Actinomyces ruminicola]